MRYQLVCGLFTLALLACGGDGKDKDDAPGDVMGPAALTEDMLAYPDIWYASVDEFGSSVKASMPVVSNGKIDIEFTIAKMAKPDEWPYAELICEPGIAMNALEGIAIRYKSSVDLALKLSQKDFGPEGNESYAHYQHVLPKSAAFVDAVVMVDDFAQPEWADEAARKIKLNLANVSAVYLVPALDYAKGETGSFALERFSLAP
jgi:hypothetical protein